MLSPEQQQQKIRILFLWNHHYSHFWLPRLCEGEWGMGKRGTIKCAKASLVDWKLLLWGMNRSGSQAPRITILSISMPFSAAQCKLKIIKAERKVQETPRRIDQAEWKFDKWTPREGIGCKSLVNISSRCSNDFKHSAQ